MAADLGSAVEEGTFQAVACEFLSYLMGSVARSPPAEVVISEGSSGSSEYLNYSLIVAPCINLTLYFPVPSLKFGMDVGLLSTLIYIFDIKILFSWVLAGAMPSC